jgi:membrane protease YdiL (CAAX protease family)
MPLFGLIVISIGLLIAQYIKSRRFDFIDSILFFFSILMFVTRYVFSFDFKFLEDSFTVQLYFFWLIIIIWLFIRKSEIKNDYEFKISNLAVGLLWGSVFGLCSVLISYPYYFQPNSVDTSAKPLLVLVSAISILQLSVAEEFVFRLLLMNWLKKGGWNIEISIFLQGIIFAFFHIETYKGFIGGLIFILFFGWFTGWLANRQKNIWGTSIMHIIINLLSLVIPLIIQR